MFSPSAFANAALNAPSMIVRPPLTAAVPVELGMKTVASPRQVLLAQL